MGIYGNIKNFFSFLGDIYFRVSTYKSLAEQHKNEFERANKLYFENQRLQKRASGLEEYIDKLEEYIGKIAEQRNLLAEELANTQQRLSEYQQGVLKINEYIKILGEKTVLESKVGSLEEEVKKLDNLCRLRQETINEYRKRDRKKIKQIDDSYKQRAEGSDKNHGYIIIREHSTIIASTPEFRESFNYNDPNKPIEGLNWFKVLKIPEDSPDYISQKQMKEFLKDSKEIKLTTTIIDGKGQEKIIRFIKHVPENFQVGKYEYYYTRVEVYEIGFVERGLRKLHIIGEPRTIAEFLKKDAIAEEKREAEQEKNKILSKKPQENKPRGSWFFGRTKKQEKKE